MADTPTNESLALGTLIGTMNGLAETLKEQNRTAAENRKEFIAIFEGIRSDNKANNDALQSHIKEDLIYHAAMNEFVTWKLETKPKVDVLWDGKNQQKGALFATGSISGIIGGAIVAAIEYFRH
jgi:hypothetical protein